MKSTVLCLMCIGLLLLSGPVFAASPWNEAPPFALERGPANPDPGPGNGDGLVLWTKKLLDRPAAPNGTCGISRQAVQGGAGWGNCDCSKCRANQSCCPTANGFCGCFPFACP